MIYCVFVKVKIRWIVWLRTVNVPALAHAHAPHLKRVSNQHHNLYSYRGSQDPRHFANDHILMWVKTSSEWKWWQKKESFQQTHHFQQADKCQRFFQRTQIQSEPCQHSLVGNESTWCQRKLPNRSATFTRSFALCTWAMLSIAFLRFYRRGLRFPRDFQRLFDDSSRLQNFFLQRARGSPGFTVNRSQVFSETRRRKMRPQRALEEKEK